MKIGLSSVLPPSMMPEPPDPEMKSIPVERVRMLVQIYAPTLGEDLRKFERLSDHLSEELHKFMFKQLANSIDTNPKKESDKPVMVVFDESFTAIDQLIETMQGKVVNLTKVYV